MTELLDKYTRAYLQAEAFVISEVSGAITADTVALYQRVNADRAAADLPSLPLPEHVAEHLEDD
jgi:hypothetical protein